MNENPIQDDHRFGDYEVLHDARGAPWLLGSGSYGQTFKARNRLLGTELAIKVIRRDLTASESVRQRFLNEGRALANLAHDHIAMLRHFGITGDGQIYYAMDYCAGGTLAERVNRFGPRPPGEALEIVRQVTCALAAAHAQGVIHRDLKPGNLMLAHVPPPVNVKVIDFGLAQAAGTGTAGGRFHGTPQWASPEQLRERPLDGRSDLFSLGLILWFLLDGGIPDAGSTTEIVQSRLTPAGYAARLPADLSADLRNLLGCLLETDPDRRFGSAAGLLDALAVLIRNHPYVPVAEAMEKPEATSTGDLPRLSGGVTPDERYARLTRLHRDLAGEWFEAELADGQGTRIVFVLDEQRARSPVLRATVRANLARLWRRPVDGLPRFAALMDNEDAMVAEWDGAGGGDFASWLKLRGKPRLSDVIAFLAGVARIADETADRGVLGVGLMASQVRLETGGPHGAMPRLFPLLLDAADLPPEINEASDASGSTLVLVGSDLACDRIHMMARLIYRAVARREPPDAVAHSADAYVPVSGFSEAGNDLLCHAVSRRAKWDSCMSLMRELAGAECLSLSGSGSGMGIVTTVADHRQAPPPAMVPTAPLPVPSRPARTRHRMPAGASLMLAILLLAAVTGGLFVRNRGGSKPPPEHQQSVVPSPASAPSATGPEVALAKGMPYENPLGMRFVEAGTKGVLFCVWETRVRDFRAFVAATRHDAVSKNEFGDLACTVELTDDGPVWAPAGGSWDNPRFPPAHEQDETCPVVCVSYFDAEAFCAWLTKRDQDLSNGWRYRLPDDREWSAACPDPFLWDDWPPPRNLGNYCGREALKGALKGYDNDLTQADWSDDWPRTSPVGSFPPNRYGLYDMGGNVWEWCATFYQASMNTRAVLDRFPALKEDEGGQNLRVMRGASWSDSIDLKMRAAYHDRDSPRLRSDISGFRVVLAKGD